MPAVWSVSVLKRLLFEPLTALVIAVWGPSPEGVLVLAVKPPSLSWESPETGALQLEPAGTTDAVTGGAATFHGNETLLSYASPSVAVTVTVSLSLKRAVPVIAPVDGSIDRPPGRPEAV
jgi:hypothetical protein